MTWQDDTYDTMNSKVYQLKMGGKQPKKNKSQRPLWYAMVNQAG